jgi:MFS family permease
MSAIDKNKAEETDRRAAGKSAYWMLGVVSFVAFVDWCDRALLSIIMEPLRHEFGFSDTQLGLLAGFAFTLLYLIAAVIIGRLADRWNRRNIIAVALATWSAMTIAFGFGKNYAHLFIARLGIGAGSAGGATPAMSMISDAFPARKRGMAMSIFQSGAIFGFSAGAFIGGLLTDNYGWRFALIAFGLFGLALSVLVRLAIDEPKRQITQDGSELSGSKVPLRVVLEFFARQKSLLHFTAATVIMFFVEYILNSWLFSFYVRSHGMSVGEAATTISVLLLVCGVPGAIFGGFVADRLSAVDERGPIWLCIGIFTSVMLLSVPVYLFENAIASMAALFAYNFIYNMYYGPMYSIPARLLRSRIRATGFALMTFVRNLVAASGPLYVGFVSDSLNPLFGEDALRYAMVSSNVLLVWGVLHLYLASKTLREDHARNPDD